MADVKWRKCLAITAIIVSLLLISGSVYLHVRQKHRYGRLNHGSKVITFNSEEAKYIVTPLSASEKHVADPNNLDDSDDDVGDIEEYIPHIRQPKRNHITEACMQCICETTTGCKPVQCGSNQPCGIFRISQGYWYDAGRQIVEGDQTVIEKYDSFMEYSSCVNNPYCAARTVAAYMSKFAADCNKDGIIDCNDYVALHILGPSGCLTNDLPPVNENKMMNCFDKFHIKAVFREKK